MWKPGFEESDQRQLLAALARSDQLAAALGRIPKQRTRPTHPTNLKSHQFLPAVWLAELLDGPADLE
jgi:hypothetical protein